MRKISFVLILTAILTLSSAVPPLSLLVQAEGTVDEKKKDVKERDKEIQEKEKEAEQQKEALKKVEEDLKKEKAKLDTLTDTIATQTKEIEKSEKKIEELEKSISKKKVAYHKQLQRVYKQGDMFYLRTLIEANDLSEFFATLEGIQALAESNHKIATGYEKDQQKLKEETEELKPKLEKNKEQQKDANKLYKKVMEKYKENEKELKAIEKEKDHLEEINEKESQEIREMIARETAKDQYEGTPSSSGWTWPVPSKRINSPFGPRSGGMHKGLDIGGNLGDPIFAANDGKVIASRASSGYGHIVVLSHGSGLTTLYAHMYPGDVTVKVGQTVRAGQMIAKIGLYGQTTGPHLHFELLKNGVAQNPMNYY
ncbi:murein hydrolase activator EnvC [Mechercharimyces sp. CAU 1602]|uniref:murein hydrolase activator EnvC family protein n=1 Tax=Mechercharimyces sp. CAU 1602 TaxID=2973933 RepID=UPI00216322A3|nr:M23 family metallopeptidase [Mechercharimyces sp. CAU 1602]MCS1352222.1 peptidoglycan DD-metalloendopeptidase family protein [Mechercharimyces sp. CAU 1602]